MTDIEQIAERDFQEKVLDQKDTPVLVQFISPYCVPCKSLGLQVEKVAEHFAESLIVYKIDALQSPDLCKEFAITSVPRLFLFNKGNLIGDIAGSNSKSTSLIEWIQNSLNN